MAYKKGTTALATLIAGLVLALGAGSVQAASDCKGVKKTTCEDKSDCSWVDGYTRKDGAKVSSHCRKKPSKSSKKKSSKDSKKKSKGSED